MLYEPFTLPRMLRYLLGDHAVGLELSTEERTRHTRPAAHTAQTMDPLTNDYDYDPPPEWDDDDTNDYGDDVEIKNEVPADVLATVSNGGVPVQQPTDSECAVWCREAYKRSHCTF
eukprot:631962-Prymnesium_polylepis.1